MIQYLIFDADHTLLEFDEDEKRSFYDTFSEYGIYLSNEELEKCRDFSYEHWSSFGLNDVHTQEIQRGYHALYRRYVEDMLSRLAARAGLKGKEKQLTDTFFARFSEAGQPIGDCVAVLKDLSARYRVCLATNGLTAVQKGRLAPFTGLAYRVFISEEVGHIKPERAFFSHMLEELNAEAGECLMIGDSLSSDIAGASACGMKSCWFNRFGRANDSPVSPDFTIKEIGELKRLLEEIGD